MNKQVLLFAFLFLLAALGKIELSLAAPAQSPQEQTPQQVHQRMKANDPKYPKTLRQAVQRAFEIQAPDDSRYAAIFDYAQLEEPYVRTALECMDQIRNATPLLCFKVTFKNMEMFVKLNGLQISDERFESIVIACDAYHRANSDIEQARLCETELRSLSPGSHPVVSEIVIGQ